VRRLAIVPVLVATATGCGGDSEGTVTVEGRLTAASSCAAWESADRASRARVADALRRGAQKASERERQIDRACARFGGEVAIADAAERLAREEHTRG
jgi:hypothetical protein